MSVKTCHEPKIEKLFFILFFIAEALHIDREPRKLEVLSLSLALASLAIWASVQLHQSYSL